MPLLRSKRLLFTWMAVTFFAFCAGRWVPVLHGDEADQKEVAQEPKSPAEWYGEGVRPTEARTAEEELAGFHLPEGFKIELIAAEPKIAKPLNMAFDERGRLWLTQSVEYPYPAKEGQGRDEVKILEDRDGNGSYETITTFCDGLNIPIGILPYGDGAICFSIPNLVYLRDTDGDGRCDKREKILGPFDTTRDTHGMVNSLHRGLDGWIYACHGFNNQSTVVGRDGHRVSMSSGNTFRFRLDGSRVEHYTIGQVNPFGMAEDAWGNLFTADCHSKPITQLIAGGCYESFGKPHDGLGFVPPVMDHLHGSTAIAGLVVSHNTLFPEAFEENFFSGNVMTSRINRNRIERSGASVRAIEKPDFLTSDDPWFRPVDLQIGPDGALYVADFYNKIIGHYEVPLQHPGRDRFRGRIWRIRYVGLTEAMPKPMPKLETLSNCYIALAHPNPVVQRQAINAIEDHHARNAIDGLSKILSEKRANMTQRANAMWAWIRIRKELPAAWTDLASSDDPWICNQAMMAAASVPRVADLKLVRQVFSKQTEVDRFAIARRSAAEAIARHGNASDIPQLIQIMQSASGTDPILSQSAKIACRDLLRSASVRNEALAGWGKTDVKQLIAIDSDEAQQLIPILLSLNSELPVDPILAYLQNQKAKGVVSDDLISRVAVSLPLERTQTALDILAETYADKPAERVRMILEIAAGQLTKLGRISPAISDSAAKLNELLIDDLINTSASSKSFPLITWQQQRAGTESAETWPARSRNAEGDDSPKMLFDSISLGEKYTGKLSATIIAPKLLTFVVAGHNSKPDQTESDRNLVQAVDVATGEVLHQVKPPRNDTAKRVEWDLSSVVGKPVRLECIDGDDQDAYAWIAVGEFSLQGLNPSPSADAIRNIMKLNGLLANTDRRMFAAPINNPNYLDAGWRFALAASLELTRHPFTSDLLAFARDNAWASGLMADPAFAAAIDESTGDGTVNELEMIKALSRRCDGSQQRNLVKLLSKRLDRVELLVQAIEQSWIGRDSLTSLDEAWWNSLPKSEATTKLKSFKPTDASMAEQVATAETRASAIAQLPPDVERGLAIFKERCALCHKLDGQGTVLGPQLEGVGGRGTKRLAEDVLLPSRNVDEAFRMSSLLLDSGTVLTGLVRQRTDSIIVIADQQGKEVTVQTADVEEEKRSELSLMPGNFGEVLSDQDLADLLAYLKASAKQP